MFYMNRRDMQMRRVVISILAVLILLMVCACSNSTPQAPAEIPSDAVANRIMSAYVSFLSYINGDNPHLDDERLAVTGNFTPYGSATVKADIENGEYTYKTGSYASFQSNGDFVVHLTYVKDSVTSTLVVEGYVAEGSPIPTYTVYNEVEYDLASWLAQGGH